GSTTLHCQPPNHVKSALLPPNVVACRSSRRAQLAQQAALTSLHTPRQGTLHLAHPPSEVQLPLHLLCRPQRATSVECSMRENDKGRPSPNGGPAGNGEREWLRRHVADESTPVGERGTRRVRDVLVGQPDRAIGTGSRCRVVAPARSACPAKGDVAGEAVLRSGARARDMDAARATGAHRGIGCAREDVRPSYGEAEERLPT